MCEFGLKIHISRGNVKPESPRITGVCKSKDRYAVGFTRSRESSLGHIYDKTVLGCSRMGDSR